MIDVTFYKLTRADLDDIMEIERLSFKTPWSRFAFLHEMEFENSVFETMKIGDKLVGYGGLWHMRDEIHISNIAIHPEHRRKGLGSRMLIHLLKMAIEKGASKATLEVRPTNLAAQRMYESFGFETIAIHKQYYSDEGEDALVMWNADLHAALEAAKQKQQ